MLLFYKDSVQAVLFQNYWADKNGQIITDWLSVVGGNEQEDFRLRNVCCAFSKPGECALRPELSGKSPCALGALDILQGY